MSLYRPDELVALIVAICFAAGLNAYATVATLGLLARADLIVLPEALEVLGSWWIIGASLVLLAIEFVADKTPGVDLIWNAAQTVVRVPVGALLAWTATTELSLGGQVLAAVGGGLVTLAAHSGKLALRGAVSTSPEPFSNGALGLTEDVMAVGLTWFATQYPWIAAAIAVTLLVTVVLVLRWIVRLIAAVARRRPAGDPRTGPPLSP